MIIFYIQLDAGQYCNSVTCTRSVALVGPIHNQITHNVGRAFTPSTYAGLNLATIDVDMNGDRVNPATYEIILFDLHVSCPWHTIYIGWSVIII